MLDVVTFKWNRPGYRSTFTAEHVNTLHRMVARHYHKPFRFNCVTDDPAGLHPDIRYIPMWDHFTHLASPHRGNNPACYRRLFLWSTEAQRYFPGKVLCIDLDMVIVDDVTPLWDRAEPIILWADQLNPTTPYNGAMQLITPGLRSDVFDTFNPAESPLLALRCGYFGTDQAWISYVLGPDYPRWNREHGALSWRIHCKKTAQLPEGARIVNFHGAEDPWALISRVPWIAEHYR